MDLKKMLFGRKNAPLDNAVCPNCCRVLRVVDENWAIIPEEVWKLRTGHPKARRCRRKDTDTDGGVWQMRALKTQKWWIVCRPCLLEDTRLTECFKAVGTDEERTEAKQAALMRKQTDKKAPPLPPEPVEPKHDAPLRVAEDARVIGESLAPPSLDPIVPLNFE